MPSGPLSLPSGRWVRWAWRRPGTWWSPRSSKPVRPSISAWRVRFPSASAKISAGEEVGVAQADPRRTVPRTDVLLAHPDLVAATTRHGAATVKAAVRSAQALARTGEIAPDDVVAAARAALPARSTTLRPVLNATGVVVHTNLGRAPLSAAAVDAVVAAAAYVDVESTSPPGARARRGRGTLEALPRRRAGRGRRARRQQRRGRARARHDRPGRRAARCVVSRGEMVEIGDGFRLPDLIASTRRAAARGRHDEPHATRRLRRRARARHRLRAQGAPEQLPRRGLHERRVASAELATLGAPRRRRHRQRAAAPRPAAARRAGRRRRRSPTARPWSRPAATSCSAARRPGWCSATPPLVERLRRHPLARALRVDKLTLAALEATLRGPVPPVADYLARRPRPAARPHRAPAPLRSRARSSRSRDGSAAGERRACPFPAGPSRSPRPTPSVCGAARPASSRASSGAAAWSTCAASRRPATRTSSGPSWRSATSTTRAAH